MAKGAVIEIIDANWNITIDRTASDEDIVKIINFIKRSFDTKDNSVTQLDNCRKLAAFLSKNNIVLGDIESDKLIEQSEELKNMFARLAMAGTLPKVYNFQNMLTLVENYSQKTNTQLETDFDVDFYNRKSENDLDLFKLYLSEIGQYKILTREEEYELAVRSRNGDKEARNKLVEHNLRLVIPVAKRYASQEVSLQDLVLAGNEGLMAAARRFDPTLGYKFSTYATWWIRQSLQKCIIEAGRTVKIPTNIYEYIIKFKKTMAIYFQENGEYPTNEYLAETFGLTIERVLTIRQCMEPVISLSTPVGNEEKDSTLGEMIEDENNPFDDSIESMDREQLAYELLNCGKLSEKEKDILENRFGFVGESKTLEEIGRKYDLSRERIRQIERLALKKLLKAYRSKKFNTYVRRRTI